MRSPHKTLAMWAIFLVVAVLLFQTYEAKKQTFIRDFSFVKFEAALKQNHVSSVIFQSGTNPNVGDILGEIKDEHREEYGGATHFQIIGSIGDEGFKLVRSHGLVPNYERSDNSLLTSVFFQWLPLILIVALFFFLFRQIQAGGGKAMSFGKSRARLLTENKHKVTFQDVAGVEEAKNDLVEIVDFLKEPKKFTRLGGRIPKGVLLVGSPGTGKTLLARAVAGEAKVPFFTISGSDFVEMFVGVGASRVRDLFEQGKKSAPCLIFIDEIDAVGRHRGAGMGGGHDEREQTLNQLLVEMDGFASNDGVIIVAATNRPDVLDPALLRPGRFDRRIVVNKPDLSGRTEILNVHTRKTPLASNVELNKVSRGTPGFSGADLENLVNEAALQAARTDKSRLTMDDFEYAKDKIIMGAERKSMIMSEEDRKITAYHEAGHALVGKILKGLDPIHKVTIIPRGMALGLTQTLPEEETVSLKKSKAEKMLAFLFGGRVAEELIFKDYTTGASNDIERATHLARKMITEWGMSEKIGPIALEKNDGPVFLGLQSGNGGQDYSDAKASEVDAEIKKLVSNAHKQATRILKEHKPTLENMAHALLEYETIDGDEVDLLLKGASLQEIGRLRSQRDKKLELEQKRAAEKEKRAEKEQTEESNKGINKDDPIGDPGPAIA